ncbi:MAG: hypothetical protein LKJ76_09830 [Lachnospiraceae bacterium]|jgi:septum site-determining protein MinC|nr:hypothetical protein [Lachnospiraceae bacterium]
MKNSVIIKSSANGITVELDDKAKFDDILEETAEKFTEGKDFFKQSAVALTFCGRALSTAEETALVNVITENSDLNIVCVYEHRPITNEIHVRALEAAKNINTQKATEEKKRTDTSWYRIHIGDVTDDTVLDVKNSILIMGNVDKSSAVVTAGNIVIMGELAGMAVAGKGTEEGTKHFICANVMKPVSLEVDGVKRKGGLFGDRLPKGNHGMPRLAHVSEGKVEIEEDAKEALKALYVQNIPDPKV